MNAITANSVLPAQRTPITLTTSDALTLVGELASPPNPQATVICVHPLPTHGGMMDSHVFRKMSWRLPALANIAVIRFNSRGTSSVAGTSEGTFDHAVGEGRDLQAAITFAVDHGLPNIWVIGWSFGTDVILKNLLNTRVSGVILLSPPLRYTSETELSRWSGTGMTVVALVPELDDFLTPQEAIKRFTSATDIQIEAVDGAKHLWVGEKYVSLVLNKVVDLIAPDHAPLPTQWDGPMDRWTDL
jgi:alpha/beta superfamily hydrolase